MLLTPQQRIIIEQTVNVFETGKPLGKYDAVVRYPDGPEMAISEPDGSIKKERVRQVTYGRSQTTEFSNLLELLQMYVAAGGQYSASCAPYLDRIGDLTNPLCEDAVFIKLLEDAGKEPIMQAVQDQFFERVYFQPAMTWASRHGFTLALSALVIYDSFVHSGRIRQELRNKFTERPPSLGGDEKTWINAYVNARHTWLTNHTTDLIRKSSYRTRDLLSYIKAQNWDLTNLPLMVNGTKVPKV